MKTTMKGLLASLLLGLSSIALAAETDAERQVRTDCQAEGQAAGLTGPDLEEFIESCIEELMGAELINVVK